MRHRHINIQLPDDLWIAAKCAAAHNRISLAEAIRRLLREWAASYLEKPDERSSDPHDAIRRFVKP